MNKQEIIEKLKTNERPFGLCTGEEQIAFAEANKRGCLKIYCPNSIDTKWWTVERGRTTENGDRTDYCYNPGRVYRITPDYQPIEKPEIVKRDVFKPCKTSSSMRYKEWGNSLGILATAKNMNNFAGYEYADGTVSTDYRRLSKDGGVCERPKYVLFVKEN